jgi:hypothetical protein
MAVRPLRDGRYVVETDGGTYVVDLAAATCTCPDQAIRHSRCKHLRRVAIEVTEGLVPAPDERRAACAVCGRRTFVPATAPGPHLCRRHEHAPGDIVRDRETGSALLVVAVTGRRADAVTTGEGRLVADYETNADYGGHEPVFECAYLGDLRVDDDGDGDGDSARNGSVDLAAPRRYSFPASRLRPLDVGSAPRASRVSREGPPTDVTASAAGAP